VKLERACCTGALVERIVRLTQPDVLRLTANVRRMVARGAYVWTDDQVLLESRDALL
jgi:hypothetical protein